MRTVLHGAVIAGSGTAADGEARDVVIDAGTIEALRPCGAAERDAVHLDAAGLYAFPGLIDCHVHLCFDPARHPEEQLAELSQAELRELVAEHARATLARGVTTVRDLASRGDAVRELKRRIEAGELRGPRIVCAGPALTTPGGHCHYVGDAIDGPEAAVRRVGEHADAGDEWIKAMVTGGALTRGSAPDRLQLPAATLRALVAAARERGLPTAAHVLSAEGGRIAARAGVRTIEHGIGLGPRELRALRDGGQYLVPTLTPSDRLLSGGPPADAEHAARLRGLQGAMRDTVAAAVERGVPLLAGSDAGCPCVEHGSVAHELALLERAGLDRAAALRAATSTAARALGLADLGAIREGAPADLLLLRGDPTDDLRWLAAPAAVIARGQLATGDLT